MSWSIAEIEPRADIEIETENKILLGTATIEVATEFRGICEPANVRFAPGLELIRHVRADDDGGFSTRKCTTAGAARHEPNQSQRSRTRNTPHGASTMG